MHLRESQLSTSVMLTKDAQLKMLRFQLNPHFLFNTLNAVSTLVLDERNDEAEEMLMRLSRFLRFALDASPDDCVALAEELDAQRLYLDIERARFSSRLNVTIDAPADTLVATLPTLILQPLVENAIKYGVSRTSRPVHIYVSARREGESLILDVRDDGPGDDIPILPTSTGVGLTNTRARLAGFYGAEGQLETSKLTPHGFLARIQLPFKPRDDTASPTKSNLGVKHARSNR